ncbi:hypothetical protein LOZ36_003287 [Ophidiomyces ophidiicola]|nr:hypothetical protein LOZ36_003287 [Ophidiomyces ophidiicola]
MPRESSLPPNPPPPPPAAPPAQDPPNHHPQPQEQKDQHQHQQHPPGAKPWLGPAPRVEPKGVYLFIWDTGAKGKFHWGLFVAQSESSGVLFHQLPIGKYWQLLKAHEDVLTSEGLLAGLKVGELDDIGAEWLAAVEVCIRAATVDPRTGLSCRSWALAALYELANGGFIWLDPEWPKIRIVEEEALRLAHDALAVGMQIISQSQLTGP